MDGRISRLQFSRRQKQVLALIAQGYTTGQIALTLGISRRTVFGYSAYLRSLTGTANNANLVHVCWQLGIFPFDEGRPSQSSDAQAPHVVRGAGRSEFACEAEARKRSV